MEALEGELTALVHFKATLEAEKCKLADELAQAQAGQAAAINKAEEAARKVGDVPSNIFGWGR